MTPSSDDVTRRINGGETVPRYRDGGTGELSIRDIFALLQSRRRRCLLYSLVEAEETELTFESIRDGVIEYEQQCQDGSATPDAVTLSLEHVHLPRLAEVGVVDWDRETAQVEYIGHPLVERWLSETRELDIGPRA